MKNLLIKNRNTSYLQYISIFLISLMLFGCFSVKPSTTKSGKNYFETFYVGEAGTQYFINPIYFNNDALNEGILFDITFRHKNEIKDTATVNFSITSSSIYKTIDSIKISNKDFEIKNDKLVLLFNEKNKTGFTSRYTTKISLKQIKEIFDNGTWEIIVYSQNKSINFIPDIKTVKRINTIKDRVFILM